MDKESKNKIEILEKNLIIFKNAVHNTYNKIEFINEL
jgi:hypothetical protein